MNSSSCPDPRHRPIVVAEAPGTDAEPADVLGRIAQVGELPVDHRREPGLVDDEVAEPEVAVHEPRPPRAPARSPCSQRSPSSTAGSGSPISSSWRSHSAIWSSAGSASARGSTPSRLAGSIAWIRGQRLAELPGEQRPSAARTPACAGCAGRPRFPRRSAISRPGRAEAGPPRARRRAARGPATPASAAREIRANSSAIGTSETEPFGSRRSTQRPASPSTSQVSRDAPPGIWSPDLAGTMPRSARTSRTPVARSSMR